MTTRDDKRGEQADSPAGEATDTERIARRKLLKMAYVAPAIIGTLLISEDAAGQQTSCTPNANPCNPPPGCKPNECKPRNRPKSPQRRR